MPLWNVKTCEAPVKIPPFEVVAPVLSYLVSQIFNERLAGKATAAAMAAKSSSSGAWRLTPRPSRPSRSEAPTELSKAFSNPPGGKSQEGEICGIEAIKERYPPGD